MTQRVAIVGGGITGLAAALALLESPVDTEIVVIDRAGRLGGKLHTGELGTVDGTTTPVELGAEAFLVRDPATGRESPAMLLARHVGLGEALVHPALGTAAVAVDGALRPLPGGTLMGVPGRLDLLGDVARPVADADPDDGRPLLEPGQDVAVGALVRRRLGDQVADRLVDPLLGGVYAGRADLLSLATTMAGLATACTTESTLTGAVRAALAASAAHRPGPGAPVFATVAGGVSRLVDALTARLRAGGVQFRLGLPVRDILRTPEDWSLVVGAASGGADLVTADAVLLAVPARPAARLLAGVFPQAAADVGVLDYASVALVTLALPPVELPELSGVLVPATEPGPHGPKALAWSQSDRLHGDGYAVKAATFFTRKWAHLRRPDGTVFVRASIGRYGDEHALQRDDADLVKLVHSELSALVGIGLPEPLDSAVQRWGGALPQYAPGHLDRVARARAALRVGPGAGSLALAGAAYDGVGIPACVRSGQTAASELLAALED
jgi:oxygen-dependent protoporphyrinogen oxidase